MLRLRVPLGKGESPVSFCSRLAYRNRISSVRDFCLDMGLTFQDVVDGVPDTLDELARLGGCDVGSLTKSAIRQVKGPDVFDLDGQSLRRASLRRSNIRVCPVCLADDMTRWPDLGPLAAYGRTEWQVAHFRTCPVHGMPLVTAASENYAMRVHDFSLLIRPTLERIDKGMSLAAERQPSGLETYLRNRLHGIARRATDWLDSLPFYAAARLCEIVGAVALNGPQVKLSAMTEDDWWEVGNIGHDALADGPDGLRVVLNRLTLNFWSRRGGTGPKALFGRLYEWLAHANNDPDYEPVREIITQHVMDTIPVGPGDDIFGKPITERRLWSVRTASAETGAHPKRLRKLLAASGFIAKDTTDLTDDRVVFPDSPEVVEFLRLINSALSLKEAGIYINAPRVQIHLLNNHGVITPFIRGGGEDIASHAFARRDLDEFVARLTADATELTEADAGLVDIPNAARAARCSAIDVVGLLLDRRLAHVRRTPNQTGYMSVLVDPDEIRPLVHSFREEGMTMKEVELATKWSGPVIRALVENGWLPSRRTQNKLNHSEQTLVAGEDLSRFTADHVSLHGLADELGRHFRRLKWEIEEAGVRPAFNPEVVGSTFYRRADLPPL